MGGKAGPANPNQEQIFEDQVDKNAQFNPLLARTIKTRSKKAKPYFDKKQIKSLHGLIRKRAWTCSLMTIGRRRKTVMVLRLVRRKAKIRTNKTA